MSNFQTSSQKPGVALAVMAHPDDIELICAGTLVRLAQAGWTVFCATASGGDLGTTTGTREAIRETRLKEAAKAVEVMGAKGYHWVGLDDLHVFYNKEALAKTTDLIRKVSPDIVITHSPDCYMLDHEETSRLVRTACFGGGIPLYDTGEKPTQNGVPHLYYADAIEGKDKYGNPIIGTFGIEIEEVFPIRQEALKCHASQREWLRAHHGIDQYLIINETLAHHHGATFGVAMAEGFRQHLGHGYPQDNLLAEALKPFVVKP